MLARPARPLLAHALLPPHALHDALWSPLHFRSCCTPHLGRDGEIRLCGRERSRTRASARDVRPLLARTPGPVTLTEAQPCTLHSLQNKQTGPNSRRSPPETRGRPPARTDPRKGAHRPTAKTRRKAKPKPKQPRDKRPPKRGATRTRQRRHGHLREDPVCGCSTSYLFPQLKQVRVPCSWRRSEAPRAQLHAGRHCSQKGALLGRLLAARQAALLFATQMRKGRSRVDDYHLLLTCASW